MLQELSVVDIVNGTKHEHRLVHVTVLALQVTGSGKHRLHSAHSVIIMLLTGELLRAKFVGCYNLRSKLLTANESERIERDLGNHSVVRDHHSYRAEQGFQVIWQFRATCVTWVHCNEAVASKFERQIRLVFKFEGLCLALNSILDALKLLCDDREYFKFNTVELIETRPCAT